MAFIFLDESGDLGFDFKKRKTSKYFLITCLFTEKKEPIEKIVKKTHGELRKKYKKKGGVLHAVKEQPVTRQRLLKRLSKEGSNITTIYLDKKKVFTHLKSEKATLYNYVANILLDRIYTRKLISTKNDIFLVAAKRETNKFLNENFKSYLNRQIKNRHQLELAVLIKEPSQEKALQAVDFASWSIFRKYEHGDESYYNIIENNIIEENPLFR